MVIYVLCAVTLLWVSLIRAVPETRHLIQSDHEGNVVHLDVTFDIEKKIVMAAVGDVSKYRGGIQTVNLHDYNMGYGVLKDINGRTCLLAHSLEPMATAEKYRIGVTSEVHDHILTTNRTRMMYEDVLGIAGPTIASFCRDYDTFFAIPTPTGIKKRAAAQGEKERRWCVFSSCSGKRQ